MGLGFDELATPSVCTKPNIFWLVFSNLNPTPTPTHSHIAHTNLNLGLTWDGQVGPTQVAAL